MLGGRWDLTVHFSALRCQRRRWRGISVAILSGYTPECQILLQLVEADVE